MIKQNPQTFLKHLYYIMFIVRFYCGSSYQKLAKLYTPKAVKISRKSNKSILSNIFTAANLTYW